MIYFALVVRTSNILFKTDNCKPMMLKMHLELDDHPPSSIGEAEHNNSNNSWRQSVQQHEEEIKALKDALLQAKEIDVVNRIDKAPDIDNNATQESNSNKQASNENKLSGEHNDTENVASASEGHHTNTKPEEKPEFIDLRLNCVYIQNVKCSDPSLEKAFCNVRKLANEMNVEIPDDSVIHIDVKKKVRRCLDYYVHFCNANIKKEFLKNRHFNLRTSPLRIFDYSEWGLVGIKRIFSSDLSLKTAYVNVIGIAKKIGIADEFDVRNSIDHIDVFSASPYSLYYYVWFKKDFMRKKFLLGKHYLKLFPETESLEIVDAGGHKLGFCDVNNVSMTVAGVAKLIGLSLATDNFQRIYVLNHVLHFRDRDFSLIVEFSSKQVKDEFLMKKQNLMQMENLKHLIDISDINAKENIVSIKYKLNHVTTVISFIGLAQQLGCSLNPDQIQYFFDLSKFIDDAKKNEEK